MNGRLKEHACKFSLKNMSFENTDLYEIYNKSVNTRFILFI